MDSNKDIDTDVVIDIDIAEIPGGDTREALTDFPWLLV